MEVATTNIEIAAETGEHDAGEDELEILNESLPTPLKLLFAFNGATEGLPTLAFTAIINDRIHMPLSVIPVYYAVEFLPYSLKPFYAIATNVCTSSTIRFMSKDVLLILLLITSAVLIGSTTFLEEGQVVQCFVIAFLRGIFISWAEFLVGLNLILSAKLLSDYEERRQANGLVLDIWKRKQIQETLLSRFQSHAASSRNFGSLLAHMVTFWILLTRQKRENDEPDENDEGSGGITQMSNELVNLMLLVTSFFPLAASFVVVRYRVYRGEISSNNNDSPSRFSSSFGFFKGFMTYDIISILLFQLLLILIGLKGLIVGETSEIFFNSVAVATGTTLVVMLICSWAKSSETRYIPANESENDSDDERAINNASSFPWQHLHYVKRVALYLILRHSTPSSGVMLSNYTYTIFNSRPLLLQTMSFLSSVASLVSSLTYGKRLAKKYASLNGVKRIIFYTTIASSLWSILSILFIRAFREENGSIPEGIIFVALYSAYQLSEGFLGELSFLPSVVLATTSTVYEPDHSFSTDHNQNDDLIGQQEVIQGDLEREILRDQMEHGQGLRLDDGLQYGLLISCIDFGDQLSGFVSMPIVQKLGMERSNEWKNLEWFVVICCLLNIVSLQFLKLLRNGCKSS